MCTLLGPCCDSSEDSYQEPYNAKEDAIAIVDSGRHFKCLCREGKYGDFQVYDGCFANLIYILSYEDTTAQVVDEHSCFYKSGYKTIYATSPDLDAEIVIQVEEE